MFLLFYENIKSERALMQQLPLRLDWLWFCGYDLDDSTPNHSVLSKARRRWGLDAFTQFFENILLQCIKAGLVDGETIHIDSSMIDANASKDSLKAQVRLVDSELYEELEENTASEKELPNAFPRLIPMPDSAKSTEKPHWATRIIAPLMTSTVSLRQRLRHRPMSTMRKRSPK